MNRRIKFIAVLIIALLPCSWLIAENINEKVVFYSVLELVKREYVKETTDKELVESAISGMLAGLDPHSSFLNEKEYQEMKVTTKGEFGGIGIEMMIDQQGIKVISPIDDTPASKAGVKPGDLIFAINDELIANMTPSEAVNKMRGNKGTKVKISILRSGVADSIEVELVRDVIKTIPVKYNRYNDVGYIRIATFSKNTAEAVAKAIKDMGKVSGYIVDMRNNPGGLLDQSVYVSNIFLKEGLIVSIKGRDEKEQATFKAESKDFVTDLPVVVMINNGSASASEIVAGALQDNKRAIILGTKSFGKGSVQGVMPLPGYGAIRLTTALYYTPSGKSIQAEGIVPDIIVEPAKIEFLDTKDKKLYMEEAKLRNHLSNKQSKSEDDKSLSIPATKEKYWAKLYEQDYQLARAIDVLKSLQVVQKWQ